MNCKKGNVEKFRIVFNGTPRNSCIQEITTGMGARGQNIVEWRQGRIKNKRHRKCINKVTLYRK